jgi:hypothetical protein
MSKTDELISKLEEYLKWHKHKYNPEPNYETNKFESEISELKEQIKKEETLPSNVKEDKLKGIIREVIWQYCYGKGGSDALFNYIDIEDAAHDITELYFQPE